MRQYLSLLAIACSPTLAADDEQLSRGEYLFQAANCYACHTDIENDGEILAGGRKLESDFGVFYAPNITPHVATGIGNWSEDDFVRALSEGIAPDGRKYYPSFPYVSYGEMTREDMLAIKAYLDAQAQVEQVNKPHQLAWYLNPLSMQAWSMMNAVFGSPVTHDGSRGSYLINVLGHCNECHTPRNALGMLRMEQQFQGNSALSAPDISTSKDGIGDWDRQQLADLFQYGELPDGNYVADHMGEVVDYSTSRWTEDDLQAAIDYLLPASSKSD